ncbi:MAG TPA: metalloregulator ArsR/SmtB family transcription factor [Ktedonobacteraceae bacterium]|jgi:DNA-binding transcriptional ArsR family regulator|nr:metalloregulator ArsR/SmtB family transcription factor [Ktedonobacteraceae bacterium]
MFDKNVFQEPIPPEIGDEQPTRRPPEIDKFVDDFLSTMCESSRRQILELLAEPSKGPTGTTYERRSTDIAKELGLSPATTSGHLKQLTDLGLLTYRREGNAIYYRIRNHFLVKAFHDLVAALDSEHANRYSNIQGAG